jgi:hypothetical protein
LFRAYAKKDSTMRFTMNAIEYATHAQTVIGQEHTIEITDTGMCNHVLRLCCVFLMFVCICVCFFLLIGCDVFDFIVEWRFTFKMFPGMNIIPAKLMYRQCLSNNGISGVVRFKIPSVYAACPVEKHWYLNTMPSSIFVTLCSSSTIVTVASPTHEITTEKNPNLREVSFCKMFSTVPKEVCSIFNGIPSIVYQTCNDDSSNKKKLLVGFRSRIQNRESRCRARIPLWRCWVLYTFTQSS